MARLTSRSKANTCVVHEESGETARLRVPCRVEDGVRTDVVTLPICRHCGRPYTRRAGGAL